MDHSPNTPMVTLSHAFALIFNQMPGRIRLPLKRMFRCRSQEDADRWEAATAEELVQIANSAPYIRARDRHGETIKTVCPLCGRAQTGETTGYRFEWPRGLRHHLLGAYRANQCQVFKLVADNCRHYARSWEEESRQAD